jgi:hypothetical protein
MTDTPVHIETASGEPLSPDDAAIAERLLAAMWPAVRMSVVQKASRIALFGFDPEG